MRGGWREPLDCSAGLTPAKRDKGGRKIGFGGRHRLKLSSKKVLVRLMDNLSEESCPGQE